MRFLWNIVSFLAVVHLLALGFFVAWLWQSDRLTLARLKEARDVFALTVAQQTEDAKKQESEAQEQARSEQEREINANPPLDSDSQLRQISLIRNEQDMALRRLENERDTLLAQLSAENDRLDDKKRDLDRQRLEWENAVRADRERKVDEQFLQAVRQLEQVTPKQAKQMIVRIVSDNQMDLAVAYLDSMSPRAASKILKEFKGEADIELATKLLEKLRTFGREAPAVTAGQAEPEQDSSNADDGARADARIPETAAKR
jgi:hypothetical protein